MCRNRVNSDDEYYFENLCVKGTPASFAAMLYDLNDRIGRNAFRVSRQNPPLEGDWVDPEAGWLQVDFGPLFQGMMQIQDQFDGTTEVAIAARLEFWGLMKTYRDAIVTRLGELNWLVGRDLPAVESAQTTRQTAYGPRDDTRRKIAELTTLRQKSVENRRQIPAWTTACAQVGISPKTARKHAPELRATWDALA